MEKIINGGMLKGKKTYITTTIGILTAIGAYFVGEMNLVNLGIMEKRCWFFYDFSSK